MATRRQADQHQSEQNTKTTTAKDLPAAEAPSATETHPSLDSDARSDASFDPLFDGELETLDDQTSIGDPALPTPSTIKLEQSQPRPSARATLGQIPPPKNAPPLLDSSQYVTYSPDLLMTASIDGQVILWDRRINTPGKGVGRLWMSEKTPPWCLSVRALFLLNIAICLLT